MNDLEITKLCAEASELRYKERDGSVVVYSHEKFLPGEGGSGEFIECFNKYDPLHDDAQAMALVKKFFLKVYFFGNDKSAEWICCEHDSSSSWRASPDLNRAICECVAKMQAAKEVA